MRHTYSTYSTVFSTPSERAFEDNLKIFFRRSHQVRDEGDNEEKHPEGGPDEFRQMLGPPPLGRALDGVIVAVAVEVVSGVGKIIVIHSEKVAAEAFTQAFWRSIYLSKCGF